MGNYNTIFSQILKMLWDVPLYLRLGENTRGISGVKVKMHMITAKGLKELSKHEQNIIIPETAYLQY